VKLAEIIKLWVVGVVRGSFSPRYASVVWVSVKMFKSRVVEILRRGLISFGRAWFKVLVFFSSTFVETLLFYEIYWRFNYLSWIIAPDIRIENLRISVSILPIRCRFIWGFLVPNAYVEIRFSN
jgi:hypothetical protein